jgi:hypothetical protein
MNEDLVYKKITGCTDVNKIKLGKYLFKVKCKWESKVKGDVNSTPQDQLGGMVVEH